MCVCVAAIEQVGDNLMKEFLRALGGWPILDAIWDESKFNLIDILARLRLYNSRVLVRMWVSADDRNSSTNVIQVFTLILVNISRWRLLHWYSIVTRWVVLRVITRRVVLRVVARRVVLHVVTRRVVLCIVTR